MNSFSNTEGHIILDRMIAAIQENKQYLSDIDGAIGDGDHGVNMNKGFSMAKDSLEKDPGDLAHGLNTLARILMMRIGGSMGPLYGTIFKTLGTTFQDHNQIDAALFRDALLKVREKLEVLTAARIGDKTLIDALYPAIEAFNQSLEKKESFAEALRAMKEAAAEGSDATRDMVARIGRSSRLGERSRGVIDAGAASCALLLGVIADGISELITHEN
jgi:dihydroxyacetone kinase-like protein